MNLSRLLSRITLSELDAKAGQPVVAQSKRALPLKQELRCFPDGRKQRLDLRRTPSEATQAFWLKIAITGPDECWLWGAGRNEKGYGYITLHEGSARQNISATRAVYWMVNGDFDSALSVLHRCDNPPCCNPRHLFMGTARDNAIDSVLKKRRRNVRLTPEQVGQIREALSSVSRKELASLYDVTYGSICDIAQGRRWAFV